MNKFTGIKVEFYSRYDTVIDFWYGTKLSYRACMPDQVIWEKLPTGDWLNVRFGGYISEYE